MREHVLVCAGACAALYYILCVVEGGRGGSLFFSAGLLCCQKGLLSTKEMNTKNGTTNPGKPLGGHGQSGVQAARAQRQCERSGLPSARTYHRLRLQ